MNKGTQATGESGRRNHRRYGIWVWMGLLSLIVSLWPGSMTPVNAAAATTLFSSLDQTLSAMAPESNFLAASSRAIPVTPFTGAMPTRNSRSPRRSSSTCSVS